MERRIFLIGFMGTGKTTVGAALSKRLGYALWDSDAEIVKREGVEIPQLFAEKGEAYFRLAEAEVLAMLSQKTEAVITTGGGAVLNARNRELMKETGYVVALTATVDEIVRRLSADESRPLLRSETDLRTRVTELLEARKGLYDFANLTVDTTLRSIKAITSEIMQNLSSSSR
jgi:shikimate kinase